MSLDYSTDELPIEVKSNIYKNVYFRFYKFNKNQDVFDVTEPIGWLDADADKYSNGLRIFNLTDYDSKWLNETNIDCTGIYRVGTRGHESYIKLNMLSGQFQLYDHELSQKTDTMRFLAETAYKSIHLFVLDNKHHFDNDVLIMP